MTLTAMTWSKQGEKQGDPYVPSAENTSWMKPHFAKMVSGLAKGA